MLLYSSVESLGVPLGVSSLSSLLSDYAPDYDYAYDSDSESCSVCHRVIMIRCLCLCLRNCLLMSLRILS